jgi:hypothetical protein
MNSSPDLGAREADRDPFALGLLEVDARVVGPWLLLSAAVQWATGWWAASQHDAHASTPYEAAWARQNETP